MPRRPSVVERIDLEELRRALSVGGETMPSFIEKHQLHITRQRLHQVCVGRGIGGRKPEWYAAHNGFPELGTKSAFESACLSSGSLAKLAREKRVSLTTIQHQRDLLGSKVELRKYAREKILVICSQCGQIFPRLRSEHNRRVKRGCRHIFCSKACNARWMTAHRRPVP